MEITEWDPGVAMGVRHTGFVTGTGRFTITPLDGGRRVAVRVGGGPHVPVVARRPAGAAIGGRTVMRRIWVGNLRRLGTLVEDAEELSVLCHRTRPRGLVR